MKRKPPALARMTGALLFAGSIGCQPPPPSAPTPPDVDALITRFEVIDGTLDAESARALVEDGLADAAALGVIGALMFELDAAAGDLSDATTPAEGSSALRAAGASPAAVPVDRPRGTQGAARGPHAPTPLIGSRHHALNVSAGSWARLTHICPGARRSVVDRANGAIVLRTVFDVITTVTEGLEAVVIWGEASKCLLASEQSVTRLDADIVGALGTDSASRLLVSLAGTLTDADGAPEAFGIELREVEGGYQLLREIEGNGRFLIGVEALDGAQSTASITDAVGTWTCSFDTDAQTGTCQRGDEVYTWR